MPSALQPHDTRLCRSCAVTLLPKLYQGITMYHIIDISPATRAWEVETVRMTSIIDAHVRYLRERNCSRGHLQISVICTMLRPNAISTSAQSGSCCSPLSWSHPRVHRQSNPCRCSPQFDRPSAPHHWDVLCSTWKWARIPQPHQSHPQSRCFCSPTSRPIHQSSQVKSPSF